MWQKMAMVWGALAALLIAVPALAGFDEDLTALEEHWATVRYQTPAGEHKVAFEQLVASADGLTQKNPERADAWIWAAVVRGSLAEATGNLSALGLAKEAKANLEKAIALDPKAEDGYAYGVLGQLYAKVPGWPLGFGDKKKAKEALQAALAISPNGADSNYFYADFLCQQGDCAGAKVYLDKAEIAPPRAKLPISVDQGRRREMQELRDKLDKATK